jgi:hypothetical protein
LSRHAALPLQVPNVAYCGNYGEHKVSKDEVELLTRFVLSLFGVKLEYFIRHTHWPSINTITWTLDYSRASDFGEHLGSEKEAPGCGVKDMSQPHTKMRVLTHLLCGL